MALRLAALAFVASACAPERPAPEVLATTGSAMAGSSQKAPGQALFLDGFFPIGVFSQPEQSFAKWKSRGINTILETPQNHDPVSWDRAAQAAGLKVIRRPAADPRQDIGKKHLLAWSHWDEPDAAGRAPQWTPLFERTTAEWRRIDPSRRIFLNFAGPDLTWFTSRQDSYSVSYASHYPRLIATADWIANDLYPAGGWLNDAHKARRGDVSLIAEPLKVLKRMTDKPLFAFIETSEIEAGNVPGARCPTAPEVRAQIWLAMIHGVRGLFYFPAVVGTRGFQFDGTPPEIVQEMQRQNVLLAELAPILQGEIGPISSSGPVAIGWRKAGKASLLIAVNPTRSEVRASIPAHGMPASARELLEKRSVSAPGGTISDSFPPLGVRLYLFGG